MNRLLKAIVLTFGIGISTAWAVDTTGQVELDAVFNQDASDDSWQDRHHIIVGPAWRWTQTGLRIHAVLSSEYESVPGIESAFLFRPSKSVELMAAIGLARFETCETVTVPPPGKHHAHHAPPAPVTKEECGDEARTIYRGGVYFDLYEADETVFYLGAGFRLLDHEAPQADISPWVSLGWRGR